MPFGINIKDYLVYETAARVRIHDPRLCYVNIALCLLTALWVAGFQILYGNEHYQKYDVHGNARITIQQPTKGCNPNDPDCEDDFTPQTELPYCNAYKGVDTGLVKHKRPCIYADQHELSPTGMLGNQMFIPTRIDPMVEKHTCAPSEETGFNCKKAWTMESMQENMYVSDIEDYTVLLVSTYYRGSIRNSSLAHQGFYYECVGESGEVLRTVPCEGKLTVKPIPCIKKGICGYREQKEPPRVPSFLQTELTTQKHGSRGSRKIMGTEHGDLGVEELNEEAQGKKRDLFAIPDGDIFRLGKLFELAGLKLDGSFNDAGEPLRERGTMLAVEVEYANLKPFLGDVGVGYIYKVVERPMKEMKTEMYALRQPDDYPATRIMENRHGILLRVSVSGAFGKFSPVYLLVMLSTSLVLLGAAGKATDMLAIHVMKHKAQYEKAKYSDVNVVREGE